MNEEKVLTFDGVGTEDAVTLAYRVFHINEAGEYDCSYGSITNKVFADSEEIKNLVINYEPWYVRQSWFALEVGPVYGFVRLHMIREYYREPIEIAEA